MSKFGLRVALALAVSTPTTQALDRAGDWHEGAGFRFRELAPETADAPGGRDVGFASIPASRSGIAFANPLPVRWVMDNNNLMNGSGVAAGDFDADGWCDLFFAGINGTNALYRNLGDWRFEDVTSKAGVGKTGPHATGAAFGDTDGDGDLDLLVATLGRGVRCFENDGRGHFLETTVQAGLLSEAGSTTLALGDVDGDGDLDLYVANYGSISILRSGGRAEMRLVNGKWEISGPYAKRLRFVDGRLEEVGEADALYLNDGKGRFRAVPWNSEFFRDEQGMPKPAPLDFGLTAQMRDLNGDGSPDIYVCNDFQTVDRIWINDGTGRFRAVPRLAMRKQSFSSMGVDFADINRDGFLDFITTEMMSRDHRLRMRQVVGIGPLIPEPGRIDNRPEVARNTLFLNRGDTTFAEIAHYAGVVASDWSWLPVFLDVDLDGFEDILIGNGMMFDVQDRDVLQQIRSFGRQTPEQSRTNLALYPHFVTPDQALRNRRDLTFEDVSARWGFGADRITQGIAQADLDNDGDLDLALNGVNSGAALLRNEARLPRLAIRLRGRAPNPFGIGGLIRVLGGPVGLQMQEILCGGHYLSCSDTLRVFAAGAATNVLAIEVRWRSGATATLEGVQPNRVYEIDEPTTALPRGASAAAAPHPPSGAASPSRLPASAESSNAREDAPASGTLPSTMFRDVSDWLGHVHREQMFPDYQRQPLLMKQYSQLGPGVAWFDLDADGQDELIVGAARGGAMQAFRWNGTNRFDCLNAPGNVPAPDDLTGLAGWVSSDGARSVFAGLSHYESENSYSAGLVRGSLAAPGGPFEVIPLLAIPGTRGVTGPLAVADIDADGDLDLFGGGRVIPGAYPRPAVARVFRQGPDGLRLDEANSAALADAGLVSGAVWSDLDGNGFPDLVLACEWGPIRLFRNERGTLSEWNVPIGVQPATLGAPPSVGGRAGTINPQPSTLNELSGWWNGVTTGDFDADGQLDIVAGNWGLNTHVSASVAHPVRLFYGDLAGLGVTDLIEAAYVPELRADAPVRGLNALGQAFPMLQGRFPTHRAFASATIEDVLDALPNPAQSVSATTLASMLFLNRRTHFVAQPLPAEAQFAPAFSVNVGDCDADGHEDLFLSQNFFALRPEVPRLDGGRGLWLRGDGHGRLTAVPGQVSGVAVYGEQRGAALGDFNRDGRVDLAVTQNGGPTRLFLNTAPRRSLTVRLEGPRGNPMAIGARMRLWRGPPPGPIREVRAGSGYWSQDAATQVMGSPEPPTEIEVFWPGGKAVRFPLDANASGCVIPIEGTMRVTQGLTERPTRAPGR
ncbi:MAG TPA: FG-GAP-like repeat-containing protein [Verrucomicrobiota bacterium]|nr:FG-GAP-like repeat-containing protein [Verrucomicrobiota bacterium]